MSQPPEPPPETPPAEPVAAPPADDLILCTQHMRRFDPHAVEGCPVCLGHELENARPEVKPWKRYAFAGAVVMLLGSFFVTGERDPAPVETPRMKAHPFRDPIEKMEWVLFAARSEGPEDAEVIVREARRLVRDMLEWESRLSMTPHIVDIKGFAAFVEARAGDAFNDDSLAAARDEWIRVRGRVFEPEDWFLAW